MTTLLFLIPFAMGWVLGIISLWLFLLWCGAGDAGGYDDSVSNERGFPRRPPGPVPPCKPPPTHTKPEPPPGAPGHDAPKYIAAIQRLQNPKTGKSMPTKFGYIKPGMLKVLKENHANIMREKDASPQKQD